MKKENKKLITILVIAIVISSGIAAAMIIGSQYLEKKEDKPLSVKIFADKNEGFTPYKVNFSSIVTNSEGKLKYYWEFGDGNTSNEREPSYTFEGNDSVVCSLTVIDSEGSKDNDSIILTSKPNRAPRVSIDISSTSPSRTFSFAKPGFWILRRSTKTWGGRLLYNLRNLGIAPMSNKKSDIQATALVSDPEGDEIVSYEWELRAPIITKRSGEQIQPTHIYTGQNVTFGLLDTYATGKYDLKLTVKDKAGNIDSELISFQVQESQTESMTFGRAGVLRQNYIQKFSSFVSPALFQGTLSFLEFGYSNFPIISAIAAGVLTKFLFDWTILKINDIGTWIINNLKPLAEKFDLIYNILDSGTLFIQNLISDYPSIEGLINTILSSIGVENIEDLREKLGLENTMPEISNPYPINNAEFIDLNTSKVYVTVKDIEGDTFNVRIFGEYINSTTNHNVTYKNVKNGTFSAPLITPLPESKEELTNIIWNVEVIDPNYPEEIAKKTYKFSTAYK